MFCFLGRNGALRSQQQLPFLAFGLACNHHNFFLPKEVVDVVWHDFVAVMVEQEYDDSHGHECESYASQWTPHTGVAEWTGIGGFDEDHAGWHDGDAGWGDGVAGWDGGGDAGWDGGEENF